MLRLSKVCINNTIIVVQSLLGINVCICTSILLNIDVCAIKLLLSLHEKLS